jgi:FAD/FMN-containing dehydrogenase
MGFASSFATRGFSHVDEPQRCNKERTMTLSASLRELLGPDSVLEGAGDTDAFTEDWRGRFHEPAACVVLPRSSAEVAAVVRLCSAHGVPVLPQGGNTSLSGGSVPAARGARPVIVSMSRMRRIVNVDPANNSMEVEAGCVLQAVQEAAVAARRLYPVSLGAEGSSQIGGTIATNAGGTSVLRYGNTRDNVLGLEVVLPDGTLWDGRYALRKNNTGYDLKHLFIGAEGTLGIITSAVLKLHPLPTAYAVAWLGVDSPETVLEILALFQANCSAQMSAYEMINGHQLDLVREHMPGRRNPLADAHPWHVLVELSDTGDAESLEARLQSVLEQAMAREWVADAVVAANHAQRNTLWELRHSVSEANKKAGVGLTTDCAVPVSKVPEFIARATDAVRALVPDMPVAVVAHMGDGNAHFIPFFTFDQWAALPDQTATGLHVRHLVNEISHSLGGTFSAEHGIGQTLIGEMAHYKPAAELQLMHAVKRAIDPQGLFNPGRVLPPQ